MLPSVVVQIVAVITVLPHTPRSDNDKIGCRNVVVDAGVAHGLYM